MSKYQQQAEEDGRVIDPSIPHTGQVTDRQTRFTYDKGPMYFLGEQIVRAMQDSGYPAFIWQCYRPPEKQRQYYDAGNSKAPPWASPHQYYEAVDILHPKLFWSAPADYWEQLAACVRIVAQRFDVELEHGYHWSFVDSAHVELKDWRVVRGYMQEQWRQATEEWSRERRAEPENTSRPPAPRPPNGGELARRFAEVLPKQWAQHVRTARPPVQPEFQTRRQRGEPRRQDRRTEWRQEVRDWWRSRPTRR